MTTAQGMTNPVAASSVGTEIADGTKTRPLREFYTRNAEAFTEVLDRVSYLTRFCEEMARNTEAAVGHLSADRHPPSTIGCATVVSQGAFTIKELAEALQQAIEAQIAADNAAIDDLESARVAEEAHDTMTAAVGHPAKNMDAYAQQ